MKTNKSPSKLIPGKATASQATPNKASAPSDPSCGVDFFDELQGLGGNGLSIQSFDSLTNQTSDNAETDPRHSDLGRWTDEQLVDAYLKHRRPEHFEVLIRRYERELFTFLRRFLGSVQHAEDVFQGTFLSVHLRIEQFEPGKRFRPWLYAIASNKAIDFMRRNKRHQMTSLDAAAKHNDSEESLSCRLASPASSPDEMAMRSENSSKVREAVGQLNEPTQQLIQLAFYQGLKYADIAQILEIPVGTVKSRVFTAMRKLNEIWLRMQGEN